MSTPPQQDGSRSSTDDRPVQRAVQGSTLLITNLAKLTGIVLAVLEWTQPGPAQDSVLAICAVFVVGAEALEKVALQMIERLFARD